MKHPDIPKWLLNTLPITAIMLGVFYVGKYFVADELIYANYQIEALQQDLQTAHNQLDEEKVRLAIAEREADVVRHANALLRASEREHQDEVAGLQADLAFYRRLGGANGSQAPLAVHYLELQATQSPRVYRILFTLTQNLRWAAVISGRVQLGVDGIRNGVAEHLTEEQLLAEREEPLSFRFKYFQQFERLITLPKGFAANRFSIRLKSRGLPTAVERSMDWQSLFSQVTNTHPVNEPPALAADD